MQEPILDTNNDDADVIRNYLVMKNNSYYKDLRSFNSEIKYIKQLEIEKRNAKSKE